MAGRGRGRERMACNPARNKQHLEAVTHSAVKTLTYSKQTNPALEYKKDQLTTKHGQVDLVAPDIKSTAHSPGYREPFSVHAVFSIPYTQLSHPVNCCIQMGASPTCKDNQPTTRCSPLLSPLVKSCPDIGLLSRQAAPYLSRYWFLSSCRIEIKETPNHGLDKQNNSSIPTLDDSITSSSSWLFCHNDYVGFW